MCALITLLESFSRHVRVDLGRAEAGMAEELLHCPEVGAAIQQMRCGSMPQGVRPGRPRSRQFLKQRGDQTVHRTSVDAPPSCPEKQSRRVVRRRPRASRKPT